MLQQTNMEKLLTILPVVCVVHQYSNDSYLNIHASLGHASARRTRYICQYNDIKGLNSLSVLAKATKRSIPSHFQPLAIAGRSWQFDVKGKIEVPSVINNAYYEFRFMDINSRKLFTYYLQIKIVQRPSSF